MDRYLIKRPRLSAEASRTHTQDLAAGITQNQNQPAPHNETPHNGETCAAAVAGTSRDASPSTPIVDNVLESPSAIVNVTSTGKPNSRGRHEHTPPASTKSNGGRGFLKSFEFTYKWLSCKAQTGKVYCSTCVTVVRKRFRSHVHCETKMRIPLSLKVVSRSGTKHWKGVEVMKIQCFIARLPWH
ncbi:unnamed protein product [Ixodes persulcatus]